MHLWILWLLICLAPLSCSSAFLYLQILCHALFSWTLVLHLCLALLSCTAGADQYSSLSCTFVFLFGSLCLAPSTPMYMIFLSPLSSMFGLIFKLVWVAPCLAFLSRIDENYVNCVLPLYFTITLALVHDLFVKSKCIVKILGSLHHLMHQHLPQSHCQTHDL